MTDNRMLAPKPSGPKGPEPPKPSDPAPPPRRFSLSPMTLGDTKSSFTNQWSPKKLQRAPSLLQLLDLPRLRRPKLPEPLDQLVLSSSKARFEDKSGGAVFQYALAYCTDTLHFMEHVRVFVTVYHRCVDSVRREVLSQVEEL